MPKNRAGAVTPAYNYEKANNLSIWRKRTFRWSLYRSACKNWTNNVHDKRRFY